MFIINPALNKSWIIADTHFYHKNIIKYCNRPDNFNELLLSNLKDTVKEGDTLYFLGDVTWDYDGLPDLLASIPGKKILVKGNHDRGSNTYYERAGFYFVCDGLIVRNSIILTHKPLEEVPNGYLNVHGHLHNSVKTKRGFMDETHWLYSPEENGYKPILLDKIASLWYPKKDPTTKGRV